MRICTVCQSPRVQDVNALLAAGKSGRSIALELGLSIDAMKRHAKHAAMSKPPVQPPTGEDPLAELVESLRPRALDGSNSGTTREYRLALAALTERGAERPEYDVLVDQRWVRLRTRMLTALDPFPEARQALVDAMELD